MDFRKYRAQFDSESEIFIGPYVCFLEKFGTILTMIPCLNSSIHRPMSSLVLRLFLAEDVTVSEFSAYHDSNALISDSLEDELSVQW